jgi:hypothetical protein
MNTAVRKVIPLMFGLLSIGIAANDFTGTWKLNVGKTIQPPELTKRLVSQIMKIENLGPNKMRITWEYVMNTGEKGHPVHEFTCDGQEHAAPEIGPGLTATCEKINATADRIVTKKDGKTIQEMTNTLSNDGKVITVRQSLPGETANPSNKRWCTKSNRRRSRWAAPEAGTMVSE